MDQDGLAQSNYLAATTPETCRACGLCMRRCPKDAIQLKFSTQSTNRFRKAVVVDDDLCIGCGVCVHKCKSKSLILKRIEGRNTPPENWNELIGQIIVSAMTGLEKEKQEK
ncbi:MAG: 4Fe-4S dicluster domain-containing protein [Proteobacteria bacterium]|nr:4Fe-4S dicluster domain-containing protein [Pseudomonadota bacterium]